MAKPVILTLDDDANVLRVIRGDLSREYGAEYRVALADSGDAALELLRELKRRGESSALFVVDQRMPRMTGVECLEKAIEIDPGAKRVLLTAYADTDAAIRAINKVQIDYYLLKPGILPKRGSTRYSPTCSMTGERPTGPPSKGSASSATSGLQPLIRSKISWRVTASPTCGSMSRRAKRPNDLSNRQG